MKSNLMRRYENKEEKKTYLADIGDNNIFFSKYIVMLICIFEIFMIIYAVIKGGFEQKRNVIYLVSYIFLLACSIFTCIISWIHETKHRFSSRAVEAVSVFYYIAIIAWSVLISVLDSYQEYQLIVYLTVIMGASNAVRIRMSISISIQLCSGIILMLLLSFVAGCGFDMGQLINVSVFVMISISLTLVLHNKGLDEFRQRSLIADTNKKLSQLNAKLNVANEQLKKMASLDPLTKVCNRLALNKDIDEIIDNCKGKDILICCAILDLDNFKKVNDTYGHLAGDASLCAIADVMKEKLNGDNIYRFGGEEFVMINKSRTVAENFEILESVRIAIEKTKLQYEGLKLTASIGYYVCRVDENTTCDSLLFEADRALYSAKQQGKNNVCGGE